MSTTIDTKKIFLKGASLLPQVETADKGKVLVVNEEGKWSPNEIDPITYDSENEELTLSGGAVNASDKEYMKQQIDESANQLLKGYVAEQIKEYVAEQLTTAV